MSLFIFCAILSLSSSLAFEVSFYTVNGKKINYQEPVLICTPHKFIYHRGDAFTIYLQLANTSNKAVAVVKNEFGKTYLTQAFWPAVDPIDFHPKFDKLTIDVELSVNNTYCVRERILEGIEVSTTRTNITALKYNDICLMENRCLVFVDPARECKDGKLTRLPCENERYVEVFTSTSDDQRLKTVYETKSSPETSRANGDSKEGAEKTYFIIMIVTSVTSAVALILLLVSAVRTRGWINSPPGIPQISPTNENPFYENVLFRKECQREIEELQQRENGADSAEYDYVEMYNLRATTSSSS